MNDFYNAILQELNKTTSSDRSLIVAPLIFADFKSKPIRLWGGTGTLITSDGQRWLGYYSNSGGELRSLIKTPEIKDSADGSSPLYRFQLGVHDEEHYILLRDSGEEVTGRNLILYNCYLETGATRATVPVGNAIRLKMFGTSFSERKTKQKDGSYRFEFYATVTAQNLNSGRSRIFFGAMNDAGQRFRSKTLFGIDGDDYAQFTARLAGGVTLKL